MRKRWNNLVGRGLVLLLLALFAVPCIACEDAVGRWLSHEGHDAVQSVHCATPGCGCAICEVPHHEAPPCGCLSDTSKVRNDKSLFTPIIPDAVLPPVLVALPEPAIVRVSFAEPVHHPTPLLIHPAVADRAPPAV